MTTAELAVVGAFYGVETGPSAIGALIAGFSLRLFLGAVIDAPIFSAILPPLPPLRRIDSI
jgi:hypothetical protein